MSAPSSLKLLRVAIIQRGKIVEERHLQRRGDVTVGPDPKCTFVLPASELPSTFRVFDLKQDQYRLNFTDTMTGRVQVGGRDLELAACREPGFAQRQGEHYALTLGEGDKGMVTLGDLSLLFQFVSPSPLLESMDLPANIRGNVFRSMDPLFLTVLAVSLILHFSGAAIIAMSPNAPEEELALDQLPDRFAKILIPTQAQEPEKTPEKREQARRDDKKQKKEKESDPVARKAALQKKVASRGLLRVLGSSGGSGGALQDVLGGSTGTADIASAIQGAAGVSVADSASVGGPKGGASGRQAGIGDLGTSGGGNVNLGNKGDVRVSGRVHEEAPEVESSDVDRNALARYVKARLKAIQSCYERELKRNPSLHGRVLVRFSITRSGRPGSIDIEENSVNEAVGSCIRTVIRGWVFPFKPADDVAVAYPFVFSPAS